MADQGSDPWKLMVIGLALTVVTAVVIGVVVANWSGRDVEHTAEAPGVTARPAVAARPDAPAPVVVPQPASPPSQGTIDSCNQHAAAQSSPRNNTKETVLDGALYGVNENRKNDAHYREAYASCMRARGYTG